MKKLIIAIAAVAFAAVTQGASIQWGGTTEAAGYNSGWANEGAVYSLYMLSANVASSAITEYNTSSGALTINGATATLLDSYTINADEYNNGAFAQTYDAPAADLNGKYFAIVLYDASQNEDFASAAVYTISGLDDGGQGKTMYIEDSNLQISGQTGSVFSTAAVPEPTSGLLMLVGLAGLALRRRRA